MIEIGVETSFRKYDLCRVYVDGVRCDLLSTDCVVLRDNTKKVISVSLDFERPMERIERLGEYSAKELLSAIDKKLTNKKELK